jgi:hypothetical protein
MESELQIPMLQRSMESELQIPMRHRQCVESSRTFAAGECEMFKAVILALM